MAQTKSTRSAIAKRASSLEKVSGLEPPKQAEWAICDISGSMNTAVSREPYIRRIDCLNKALRELGEDTQVIAFSDKISREKIGEFTAGGTTNYCPALREALRWEPTYIVIISDGEITDSKNEALGLVKKLANSAIIDCIYIGPDDSLAEGFMKEIAQMGNGRFRKYDPKALEDEMQKLLPPPTGSIELN